MDPVCFVDPLWAAGRDWIPTLILLFFVFLPAIGQFISKILEAQKEAARRAARQAKGGGPVGGGAPQDPIEREIADFLRRVTGQQEKPKPEAPAPPPVGQAPAGRRPVRPASKPVRRPAPSHRPASAPPVPAELVSEAPSEPTVAKRAEAFLRTDQIETRTAQLGSSVSRVDQELEARLQEKFDRELQDLGRLPSGLSELSSTIPALPADGLGMEAMYGGPTIPPTAPTSLGTLLATADSVREAIILYEILQPPWQRWS